MNALGIDSSLTAPGFAGEMWTETFRTDEARGEWRLIDIRDRLRHHVRRAERAGDPYTLAAIEGPAYGAPGQVVQLGMVQAAIRIVLMEHGIPYAEVSPTTLKCFATGSSTASKDDMLASARGVSGLDIADDNGADAWWLWRMGAAALHPQWRGLSTSQLERLGHVQWPMSIEPYGPGADLGGKVTTKKCRHEHWCLRSGVRPPRWLHPLTFDVCDRPPK
jgi:Holliday junction resolvasome RuvABC endonuclease subunit